MSRYYLFLCTLIFLFSTSWGQAQNLKDALKDTSMLSTAKALAEMRRDYSSVVLDSFFHTFTKDFSAVGQLLNDATIWKEGLTINAKQILTCQHELKARDKIAKMYHLAIDSVFSSPNHRARIGAFTAHLRPYLFYGDSAKLATQSEFGTDLETYRATMVKIISSVITTIPPPNAYANALPKQSNILDLLKQTVYNDPSVTAQNGGGNGGGVRIPFGISEQELLWGLTNFIVDRFKSEIQNAFFDRLQSLMRQSHAHEFFPESVRLLELDVISQKFANIQHTSELSGCFRAAIERDLRQMPENLLTAVSRDAFLDSIGIDVVGRAEIRYLRGSLDIISLLRKGEHPTDILDALSLRYDNINAQLFDRQIQFLQLISNNLRVNKSSNYSNTEVSNEVKNKYWWTFESLKKHYNLEDLPKYFVALLYHQDENLFKALNISPKLQKQGDLIFRKVNRIIFALNQTEEMLAQTRNVLGKTGKKNTDMASSDDSLRFSYYIKYAISMFDAVEQVLSFSEDNNTQHSKYAKWLHLAERFSETAKAAETRNYFSLMDNTVILLNEIALLIPNEGKQKSFKQFVSGVSLYGAFATDLLHASDEKQVKAVLSKYALPSGSALIKRRGNSHVHINAYAGMFLGGEMVQPDPESERLNRVLISLSAPVGIDYSFVDVRNRAWSGFLSVIDLGAMFSYRLADGQVVSMPEISFSNVFAPGFFIYRHFKSIPLSIGASVQLSPRLRELTRSGAKVNTISAYRFGISAKVDIPIFRLGTRYD